MSQDQDGPTRHLVLCQFQPGTILDHIEAFIERFRAVTRAIPGIMALDLDKQVAWYKKYNS